MYSGEYKQVNMSQGVRQEEIFLGQTQQWCRLKIK